MIEVQRSSVGINEVGNRVIRKGDAAEGILVFPRRRDLGCRQKMLRTVTETVERYRV